MHFHNKSIQWAKQLSTTLVAVGFSSALVSCGIFKGKDKEEPVEEPTEQPVAHRPAAPKPIADPTALFRTPNDAQLPTDEQLKQGAESSIGTGDVKPITDSPTGPSTTVKPPKPDEDQLDPGE
ncbi:MAG: hypothetical protein AB8F34_03790 [Akkermansiaceae bacterium]